jgi:hypothetical protein
MHAHGVSGGVDNARLRVWQLQLQVQYTATLVRQTRFVGVRRRGGEVACTQHTGHEWRIRRICKTRNTNSERNKERR